MIEMLPGDAAPYSHPATAGGIAGAASPTFQFHPIVHVDRRRHITRSLSANMPCNRSRFAAGIAAKCM